EAAHAAARRRQIRELQARVAQRGALAAAGRPDDRVPGERVEGLLAALLGRLERRDRLLELGVHLGDLVLEVGPRGGGLLRGLRGERLLQLAGGAALAQLVDP